MNKKLFKSLFVVALFFTAFFTTNLASRAAYEYITKICHPSGGSTICSLYKSLYEPEFDVDFNFWKYDYVSKVNSTTTNHLAQEWDPTVYDGAPYYMFYYIHDSHNGTIRYSTYFAYPLEYHYVSDGRYLYNSSTDHANTQVEIFNTVPGNSNCGIDTCITYNFVTQFDPY